MQSLSWLELAAASKRHRQQETSAEHTGSGFSVADGAGCYQLYWFSPSWCSGSGAVRASRETARAQHQAARTTARHSRTASALIRGEETKQS